LCLTQLSCRPLEARLLQPHLQADAVLADGARSEIALGDEMLELGGRVGAAPQHRPQHELGREGVEAGAGFGFVSRRSGLASGYSVSPLVGG
jgi:hypothetical protein